MEMQKPKPVVPDPGKPRAASPRRKPYAKPRLEPLGDLRDVTMAGSLGAGESGMKMTRKP